MYENLQKENIFKRYQYYLLSNIFFDKSEIFRNIYKIY